MRKVRPREMVTVSQLWSCNLVTVFWFCFFIPEGFIFPTPCFSLYMSDSPMRKILGNIWRHFDCDN